MNFNEYTFRTSRNNYQDAMNECLYLTKQYKTFVQIAPDYAFGQGSAAAFRDVITSYSIHYTKLYDFNFHFFIATWYIV